MSMYEVRTFILNSESSIEILENKLYKRCRDITRNVIIFSIILIVLSVIRYAGNIENFANFFVQFSKTFTFQMSCIL